MSENKEKRKEIITKALEFFKDEENQKKMLDMAANITKVAVAIVEKRIRQREK